MRKLDDWITGFHEYCQGMKVPYLFSQWAAIVTLGSIMQRRYWITSFGQPQYGALYVIMVGEPSVGKGLAIKPATEILRKLPGMTIATDSMTTAHLGDEFNNSETTVTHIKGATTIECSPIVILAKELKVLMPIYDGALMGRLINVWDFEGYSEGTRKHQRIDVPNAHASFLAGTTPFDMGNLLPDEAWRGGFMSRCIVAYSGEVPKRYYQREAPNADKDMIEKLVADAKQIMQGLGELYLTDKAILRLNDWIESDCEPKQTHPKMLDYNSRRPANLMRAALISAISRGSDAIEEADIERILDLLIETEAAMVESFKAMSSGGDQQVMKECYHTIQKAYLKNGAPVRRSVVVNHLSNQVPSFRIESIISAMLGAGLIVQSQEKRKGICYAPAKFPTD